MELYYLYGKYPVSRYGIDVHIEVKIFYLPETGLKFIVNDRDVRDLSLREEDNFNYYFNKLNQEGLEKIRGRALHSTSFIYLIKKNIKNRLLEEIIKAHKLKDREFFFNLKL